MSPHEGQKTGLGKEWSLHKIIDFSSLKQKNKKREEKKKGGGGDEIGNTKNGSFKSEKKKEK